jgi:hypothetical protein
MKKYILLAAILMSNSVYAESGHGYTVTGETFTCSPGANCGLEHLPANHSLKKNMSASTKAQAPNRNGVIRNYNQVDGYHDITIVNRTHVSQSYQYSYSLDCADARFNYSKYVTLTPGGTYSTSDHSYATVQKDRSGSHRITASTKVTGESSDSATGTGTLTISNR